MIEAASVVGRYLRVWERQTYLLLGRGESAYEMAKEAASSYDFHCIHALMLPMPDFMREKIGPRTKLERSKESFDAALVRAFLQCIHVWPPPGFVRPEIVIVDCLHQTAGVRLRMLELLLEKLKRGTEVWPECKGVMLIADDSADSPFRERLSMFEELADLVIRM